MCINQKNIFEQCDEEAELSISLLKMSSTYVGVEHGLK